MLLRYTMIFCSDWGGITNNAYSIWKSTCVFCFPLFVSCALTLIFHCHPKVLVFCLTWAFLFSGFCFSCIYTCFVSTFSLSCFPVFSCFLLSAFHSFCLAFGFLLFYILSCFCFFCIYYVLFLLYVLLLSWVFSVWCFFLNKIVHTKHKTNTEKWKSRKRTK